MNMFKKNGGFTLVELIVAIAILAILAGVAIPVYSGYIKKAQSVQDDNLIASLETGLIAAATENSVTPDSLSVDIEADATAGSIKFTFGTGTDADKEIAADFASYIGASAPSANVVVVDGFKYATDLNYADGQLTIAAHN